MKVINGISLNDVQRELYRGGMFKGVHTKANFKGVKQKANVKGVLLKAKTEKAYYTKG